MIAHDVLIHEIDPRHWANLWRVLGVDSLLRGSGGIADSGGAGDTAAAVAPAADPRRRAADHGPVLLFVEQGRTCRAIDLAARRAFPPPPWEGAGGLDALRRALGAPVVVAFEDDGLSNLVTDLESALRFGDDPLQDLLGALAASRKRLGRDVHVSPRPYARIPIPTYAMIRGALDLLWPPGTAACFYLFENGRVWTSLVVARDAEGRIDLVTTHQGLAGSHAASRAAGPRDREAIVREIGRVAARPLHLGFFASTESWTRALRDGESFESERQRGGLAIDPAPPWLRAALGASQVARTARGAASLFAAVAPRTASVIAGSLRGLAQAAAGSGVLDALRAQLNQMLGFDPVGPDSPLMAAIAWLRRTARGGKA